MTDIFPHGIPHNGVLHATSTDSLLRVHARILRQRTQTVDASNIITGVKGSGRWTQVGRNALPLFNAGLVGTQRQTLYLRSSPNHDVSNFGATCCIRCSFETPKRSASTKRSACLQQP
jgi:hypothetical protein